MSRNGIPQLRHAAKQRQVHGLQTGNHVRVDDYVRHSSIYRQLSKGKGSRVQAVHADAFLVGFKATVSRTSVSHSPLPEGLAIAQILLSRIEDVKHLGDFMQDEEVISGLQLRRQQHRCGVSGVSPR